MVEVVIVVAGVEQHTVGLRQTKAEEPPSSEEMACPERDYDPMPDETLILAEPAVVGDIQRRNTKAEIERKAASARAAAQEYSPADLSIPESNEP